MGRLGKYEVDSIVAGDALEVLRELPDGCVQCCVTSPPYWGLRDYGVDGQLGLEATPEEYVAKMVEIFREVRRVLRDDGTLWLNLGDSYAGGNYRGGGVDTASEKQRSNAGTKAFMSSRANVPDGLKPKDLCGIPWRVALALQADGWWLRSDIIWHKTNPMPESVTDRPTKAHEYLFLMAKSQRYFYDADAVREPHVRNWGGEKGLMGMGQWASGAGRNDCNRTMPPQCNPAGRNRRTVFSCPSEFAKMRDDLPEETKQRLVAELLRRGII